MDEKTTENENEGLIHRYFTENEKETNQDTLNRFIEEFPDDTSPVVMEECVNYELDYENKNNAIEENHTTVNDEDMYDAEVNEKEEY